MVGEERTQPGRALGEPEQLVGIPHLSYDGHLLLAEAFVGLRALEEPELKASEACQLQEPEEHIEGQEVLRQASAARSFEGASLPEVEGVLAASAVAGHNPAEPEAGKTAAVAERQRAGLPSGAGVEQSSYRLLLLLVA